MSLSLGIPFPVRLDCCSGESAVAGSLPCSVPAYTLIMLAARLPCRFPRANVGVAGPRSIVFARCTKRSLRAVLMGAGATETEAAQRVKVGILAMEVWRWRSPASMLVSLPWTSGYSPATAVGFGAAGLLVATEGGVRLIRFLLRCCCCKHRRCCSKARKHRSHREPRSSMPK